MESPNDPSEEQRDLQRIDYEALFAQADPAAMQAFFDEALPAELERCWIGAYRRLGGLPDIVEVKERGFSYLFDLTGERPIAAYGRIGEPAPEARDRSRLAGYPRASEGGYHKGHLIAHRLGGGLDINIIHQIGANNIGPFRRLEADAARNPGSFYFVRLIYAAASVSRDVQSPLKSPPDSQRPGWIEQGLILPQLPLRLTLREFEN